MKKLLLSAAIVLGSILSMQAQTTIMAQPFGTATIPGGWSQTTAAVAADNWKFTNAWGTNMASAGFTMQGYCACIDDYDNNPSQATPVYDTLKGPTMNCAAYPKVYISLNYWFFNDDAAEVAQILYSTNSGATWHLAVNLPMTQSLPNYWSNNAIYDISAYAGGNANVMIAFAYYDGIGSVLKNIYVGTGMCVQDVDVYAPANYDVQVETQNHASLVQVGTAITFSGMDSNIGGMGITTMHMNYTVNHGTTMTQNITGIAGFNGLTTYNWSMPGVQWTPPAPGVYTVRFWADNLDGANSNPVTDTLVATFWAVNTVVAKQTLYEEQTGQSCVFCMLAAPNMDSVYDNNKASSNIIRYHVPIPARDFMYDANATPSNQKEGYYGITGAPWGDMDGSYLNPSAYQNPPANSIYSSTTLQAENAIGSPIKIDITSSTFDATKDSFHVSANITAYSTFTAGQLTAQVALTIDSINYKYDLSMDDPQQEFAPPIGSNASGYSYQGCPDYFYPFVLNFTHVCEEMFPNSGNGTALAAFTSGQTQTVSFGWKKNHPWASYDHSVAQRDSDLYDSSTTGQFVVFVQTNAGIGAYGIPAKYVFQSASAPVTGITTLGVQKISDGVSFQMYPNPTNNNTNITFKLENDKNITVDVYNMLGEKVYTNEEGMMSAGQHMISINGSNLQNGVYFVRFNADNVPTTQKLIIQR